MKRAALLASAAAALVSFASITGCSGADQEGASSDETTAPPSSSLLGADASASASGSGNENDSESATAPKGDDGDQAAPGCTGTALDPAAVATVSSYFDKLPYGAPTGAARSAITEAILRSCAAFGPSIKEPGFEPRFCWAHLVSAIEKESSFNVNASVSDSYGTRNTAAGRANDPTVGLTQIRFSSTVRDMVVKGNTEALSCAGCVLPSSVTSHASDVGDSAYWAVTGPAQNMSLMKSPACNVGLGAWYYYYNATSNGKASAPTYLATYCGGGGTPGNLITGLLSHLEGPENGKGVIGSTGALGALKSSNGGGYDYVSQIKTWFDGMVGPISGTHPFFMTLAPNASQYCR
ncbi:MAG: hypothetical protein JWP97_4571 [Labilithrix sp.]|nr:hypothetical protein [Labilithrix sp.]